MIKFLSSLGLALLLSGCASTYTLEGKKYDNEQAFQAAVDNERTQAVAQVQPLPAPLTKKKLIAAFPSEQALHAENSRRHTAIAGRPPMGLAVEQIANISKSNYKLTRVAFEGVQKRGIYSEVEIREMPSMVVSIEPSMDYDVLYYTEPSIGTGQFFYSSVKHGKQIFAFDRSGEGVTGKVKAFVEATQVQAIKE